MSRIPGAATLDRYGTVAVRSADGALRGVCGDAHARRLRRGGQPRLVRASPRRRGVRRVRRPLGRPVAPRRVVAAAHRRGTGRGQAGRQPRPAVRSGPRLGAADLPRRGLGSRASPRCTWRSPAGRVRARTVRGPPRSCRAWPSSSPGCSSPRTTLPNWGGASVPTVRAPLFDALDRTVALASRGILVPTLWGCPCEGARRKVRPQLEPAAYRVRTDSVSGTSDQIRRRRFELRGSLAQAIAASRSARTRRPVASWE